MPVSPLPRPRRLSGLARRAGLALGALTLAPLGQAEAQSVPVSSIHIEPTQGMGQAPNLVMRHSDAAAAIEARAAEQAGGSAAAVRHLEATPFDLEAEARALAEARVVTVSMTALADFAEIGPACDRFAALPGLLVQAAGNDGHGIGDRLQAQQPSPLQCADLILRVGASSEGRLEDYSSRSTPDLVGENPFRLGFGFALLRTPEQVLAELDRRAPELRREYVEHYRQFTLLQTMSSLPSLIPMADRLQVQRELQQRSGPAWNRLCAEAETYLLELRLQLSAKASEALEADRNGAAILANRTLPAGDREPRYRDAANTVRNSDGTSWVAPSIGGTVGAVLQQHPSLTEEDALVAALVTARKLTAAWAQAEPVGYRLNGRGLAFNPNGAGFGLFDADAFAAAMARMDRERMAAPERATRRVAVAPAVGSGTLKDGIALTVRPRGVALRGIVVLEAPASAPAQVLTLVAPDGSRIDVSPARSPLGNGREQWTFATSGMLGAGTRGTWRVFGASPDTVTAQLRLVAVQPGSVADRAIDAVTRKAAQPLAEAVGPAVDAARRRWSAAPVPTS